MRKLIVSSFVSLDGVIESPMTWISPFFDDESKEYAYKQLADVEFFLLGRVTYDVFSARWPQIRGDKYFDRINSLKKLVASTSRSPRNAPLLRHSRRGTSRGQFADWVQPVRPRERGKIVLSLTA